MRVVIWLITALLAIFAATGVLLVVSETRRMRRARAVGGGRRQGAHGGYAERYRAYVGEVDLDAAPLTPPLRVGAEFLGGLCGFPGLGWMISGRIAVGLPLIIGVPAAMWAFFPLYVSFTQTTFSRPLAVFAVLPAIAVASAAALAASEVRRARAL